MLVGLLLLDRLMSVQANVARIKGGFDTAVPASIAHVIGEGNYQQAIISINQSISQFGRLYVLMIPFMLITCLISGTVIMCGFHFGQFVVVIIGVWINLVGGLAWMIGVLLLNQLRDSR